MADLAETAAEAGAASKEYSPVRLTLPYPVSGNVYWRHVVKRVGRKTVAQVVVSEEAKQYRALVVGLALRAGVTLIPGEVTLRVRLYRPHRSGDTDNFLKVLIDALRGVAYRDDGDIARIEAERFSDPAEPRAEVEVTRYVPPVIFQSGPEDK